MDAMLLLEWQRRLPIRFRCLRTDGPSVAAVCVTRTNGKSMRKIDALLSDSAMTAVRSVCGSVGGWQAQQRAQPARRAACRYIVQRRTPVTYELNGSE